MVVAIVRRQGEKFRDNPCHVGADLPLYKAPLENDGLATMSLFSHLNPAKDYLLAGAVKLWFNQTLKRYGQMTHIRIDSENHRIDVELELKGESSPIQLALKSYELSSEAGETFIAIGEIETSRGWINQLISDYLPPDKKRFKVPGAMKVLL